MLKAKVNTVPGDWLEGNGEMSEINEKVLKNIAHKRLVRCLRK